MDTGCDREYKAEHMALRFYLVIWQLRSSSFENTLQYLHVFSVPSAENIAPIFLLAACPLLLSLEKREGGESVFANLIVARGLKEERKKKKERPAWEDIIILMERERKSEENALSAKRKSCLSPSLFSNHLCPNLNLPNWMAQQP